MIKISDEISLNHRNGYYMIHTYKKAKDGQKKGEYVKSTTKTYARIFGAWDKLKELFVDSNIALERLVEAKEADVYVIKTPVIPC